MRTRVEILMKPGEKRDLVKMAKAHDRTMAQEARNILRKEVLMWRYATQVKKL